MTDTDHKTRLPVERYAVDRSARQAVEFTVAEAAELHRRAAFIRGRLASGYSTPGQLKMVRQQADELQQRASKLLMDFESARLNLPQKTQTHSRLEDIQRSLSKAIADLRRLTVDE